MNEDEINNILELTKKKIAISQFNRERVKKNKKSKIFMLFHKISIALATGAVLTTGCVGAYVGITGNTELLKKIGINIGEHYEEFKQEVDGTISGKGFSASLVSAACDSTCIVLEMDFKLDKNKYDEVDFKIDNLTITGKNFEGSTKENLVISESSVSNHMEDGTIKVYKYISVKDPNLGADGFLNEAFERNENEVECILEFSEIYDSKSKKKISEGNWKWDFKLKRELESEFVEVDKEIKKENVIINIDSISKSSLGNYISLIATQYNVDINKENDIQKLKYIIKNSKGEKISIISKTVNMTGDLTDGLAVNLETTLKLDDISGNIDYDIDVQIGEEVNIETRELEKLISDIKVAMEDEKRLEKEIEIEKEKERQEHLKQIEIAYSKWDNSSIPQILSNTLIGVELRDVPYIIQTELNGKWMGTDSFKFYYILYKEKIYAVIGENEEDEFWIATNILKTDIDPKSLGERVKDNGNKVLVTAIGEYYDYTDNKDNTYSIFEGRFKYIINSSGIFLDRELSE